MRYVAGDTIAAVATPLGTGGLAVIRISGPQSIAVADHVFKGGGDRPSNCGRRALMHGHIHDREEIIDEVMLLVMRKPHSYTKEDVVEIQGHGGPVVTRRVLRRVLDEGVRPAEPGEFTLRAFLNGRLDLLQAEAVSDFIHARSERGAQAAMEQLEGVLSHKINAIYAELMDLSASVEVTLDFVEEAPPTLSNAELLKRCICIQKQMEELAATYDEGRLLREGAHLVICGRPNAGKSTLLNKLLNTDRAIVSPTPGTTRDVVEASISIDGIPVLISDTAGLRHTTCPLEEEGIRHSLRQMEKADLFLYVMDAVYPLEIADDPWSHHMDVSRTIFIINKIDLAKEERLPTVNASDCVKTSLLCGTGVEDLRRLISSRLAQLSGHRGEAHAFISTRHIALLNNALAAMKDVQELLQDGSEGHETRAAIHLREASESIGQIVGRVYSEELLETIFARFCIGK